MIRIAVIGCGYWGPNLVRNFNELDDVEISAVSDLKPDRLQLIKKKFPNIDVTVDHNAILDNPYIDAIAIATPVETHFPLASEALKNGKSVFIEKPLTSSVTEAEELINLAERYNKTLMVGHTFIYTGAVRKIKEIIEKGEIGNIYYFDSVRVNLGLFRPRVNVIWDLAPHDVSIMDYLLGANPEYVSAVGVSHFGTGIENIAYITINYPDNLLAHIHVNWLAPVKLRKVLISGSKKMIVYDDTEPDEKVKIYDKGIILNGSPDKIYDRMVGYRIGDMYSPKIDSAEALRRECSHFIDCIDNNKIPITDGYAGLRVVRILQAAQLSIENKNERVELKCTEKSLTMSKSERDVRSLISSTSTVVA